MVQAISLLTLLRMLTEGNYALLLFVVLLMHVLLYNDNRFNDATNGFYVGQKLAVTLFRPI